MIRPPFAPVPTAIDAVSPAALMLTVAVPVPNAQLTAPSAGAGAATTAATTASDAIRRHRRIVFGGASEHAARAASCTERGRPDTGSERTFHNGARSPVTRRQSKRRRHADPERARSLARHSWSSSLADVPSAEAEATAAARGHHRDDLRDGRRIGGIALALVARRPASMESSHRRGRPAAASGIERHFGHDASS
jgi:hypothetical protein